MDHVKLRLSHIIIIEVNGLGALNVRIRVEVLLGLACRREQRFQDPVGSSRVQIGPFLRGGSLVVL